MNNLVNNSINNLVNNLVNNSICNSTLDKYVYIDYYYVTGSIFSFIYLNLTVLISTIIIFFILFKIIKLIIKYVRNDNIWNDLLELNKLEIIGMIIIEITVISTCLYLWINILSIKDNLLLGLFIIAFTLGYIIFFMIIIIMLILIKQRIGWNEKIYDGDGDGDDDK